MNAKLIASLILAGLAVVFIIQNVAVVELKFLFWTLSMSGTLLIFLILSVGTILGWLLRALPARYRLAGDSDRRSPGNLYRYPAQRLQCTPVLEYRVTGAAVPGLGPVYGGGPDRLDRPPAQRAPPAHPY